MLLYHRPVPAKIPKRRSRAGEQSGRFFFLFFLFSPHLDCIIDLGNWHLNKNLHLSMRSVADLGYPIIGIGCVHWCVASFYPSSALRAVLLMAR